MVLPHAPPLLERCVVEVAGFAELSVQRFRLAARRIEPIAVAAAHSGSVLRPGPCPHQPIEDQMLSMAARTLPCANARPPRISTRAARAKPRPTSRRPITGSAAKPATTRNSTV